MCEVELKMFFKNQLPKYIVALVLFGWPMTATATTEYQIPNDNAVLMAPSATDSIYDLLNQKNWAEGKNYKNPEEQKGKFFLAIGVGVIAERRDADGYIESRNNAFDKAYLQAKKSLAEFMEAEISASLSSFYEEPSDVREQARIDQLMRDGLALEAARTQAAAINTDIGKVATKYDSATLATAGTQAEMLVIADINKALIDKGFDPTKPVAQAEIQKILSQENFQKSITVAANARIAGAQVYKSFEVLPESNQGEIGVVLIYSDKLHNLANAIYSFNFENLPRDAPRDFLKNQIPTDPNVLMATFGVNMKIDENGQPALIAYGQSGAKTSSTRSMNAAYNKAIANAQALIRFFAGEIVKSGVNKDNSESMTELENSTVLVSQDDSYIEEISSVADTLKINFSPPLHRWRTQHPLTKHIIAGVVISWTVADAEMGRAMKTKNAVAPPKNTGNTPSQQLSDESTQDITNGKSGSSTSAGASASDDF